MSEPLAVGVATKVVVTLIADGIKVALGSVWKYYTADDSSTLPQRTTVAELSNWLQAQFAQVVPSGEFSTSATERYLKSAEFITFLEALIAFHLGGRPVSIDGPLMRQLISGASIFGEIDRSDTETLFRVVNETVRHVFNPTQRSSDLTALDESSSQLSFQFAMEAYLSSIDHQISILCGNAPFKMAEIREKLQKYRRAVIGVLGRVQPPNFDGAATVPINSLYVVPTLTKMGEQPSVQRISLDNLLKLERVVVLGDPGGGKTTLSKKVAHDLAAGKVDGMMRGDCTIVPFVIVLRDFGVHLQNSPGSVADFISHTLKSTFQISLEADAIEWLLATGQAYVIFDGLDELLETRHRTQVADVVNAFSIVHPAINVLVTSRKVGYQQAPLADDIFESIMLGEFNQGQLQTYVRNWFNLDRQLSPEARSELASAFIAESETVGNVRQNPLMLALMCTIYRTEAYIPRNRPDLYEKCSKMLFDRWDRRRGLLEPFEFEAHVEPALMHIAHRIYEDPSLQSGITETQLVRIAADYLNRWQYEDFAKARHAAEKFISFCRGRAWVFTDVGLTPDNEALYQFTHRTFLEFFTASFLAREYVTIEDLCARLGDHVDEGSWDVVVQLALQVKTKGIIGGPDKVAHWLIERAQNATKTITKASVLSFIVRSLSFLVTSPTATRALANTLVDELVTIYTTTTREIIRDRSGQTPRTSTTETILDDLSRVAREVRELLFDALTERLSAILVSHKTSRTLSCAASIAWRFDMFCTANSLKRQPVEVSARQEQLWNHCIPVMRKYAHTWPWAANALFHQGHITAEELLELLGTRLFSEAKIPASQTFYVPPAYFALSVVLRRKCTARQAHVEFDSLVDLLRACAELIISESAANKEASGFTRVPQSHLGIVFEQYESNDGEETHTHRALTPNEAAATSVILAFCFEQAESGNSDTSERKFGRNDLRHLNLNALGEYRRIFDRRIDNDYPLDAARYTSNNLDAALVDWAHRRRKFTE